ncbi:Vomp family autotransporter [Bartonella krasnovii]|uniref:Vomp family autotransporter n=1 Tax=Bartonella krasnovii TaxID=2267275 RepID=UPI001F4CDE04|nr:Vomp family autotransporter [Bartonella krasnovii]UNF37214.1 Vomp family autotransporter [Bartonella krasnovii]UNF38912.1 Vomp family autotransporter [Bartonella krasnovii]UNF50450.1 Vomp family autotransporter [Bartonella krasnovii]
MKKKYSTPSLIKAVSLSAAMATLLSSVSPVFAANLAIRGGLMESTPGASVSYTYGSHGSIVFAGDDDFCGADNVIGRGGKQQASITNKITAEEQYNRFINGYSASNGGNPYGETTSKVTWISDGNLTNKASYMGTATGGSKNILPEAYGVYSFATGCGSAATGNYSTAFGAGATAKTGGSQAFGVSALASGKATVAMGIGSEASGDFSVAFGGLATASGKSTVAVGTKAKAEKEYAIAIGSRSHAKASGAIAIGSVKSERTEGVNPQRETIAEAENAIAIGSHTYAKTEDSVAVGVNAQVLVNDGVAIGGGSVSDRDKGVKGYDPYLNGDTTESGMAWISTTGAFSVGEVGGSGNGKLTRQITGVAAGSKDTDAVNVAQLKAMRDVIAGAWKLSANDTDPTDVNSGNVVDFSVKDTKVGKDNLTIEKRNENKKHKIEFALSDNLKLISVTTGQSSMSGDGFIINDDGPRMTVDGIDAGDEKITRVKAGEDDTDAVNFKQLREFTAGIKGGGWKLSVEDGEATDVEADSTVDFSAVASEDGSKNIKIVKGDENKVTFALADDINVMSVTAGESVMSAAGFGFENGEGPSITVTGIHAGNKTIKGVAEAVDNTDAVNFGQLQKYVEKNGGHWKLSVDGQNATDVKAGNTVDLTSAADEDGSKNITIDKTNGNKVTFALNNELKLTSVTTGNSIMSDGGFTFADGGPSMTVYGIDAGYESITNVKAGEKDTDAVNFGQLQKYVEKNGGHWKLSVDGNNATDVKAGSTVDFVAGENEYGSQNVKIKKDNDNKVTFTLNDDLKLTSVTTGNSIMNNDGFSFVDGGPKITANGIDAGNKKITQVAAGEQDTDAVNYKQLKEIKNQIVGDSLVKWDEDGKLITIGAEKEGIEINITNSKGKERIIAGVAVGKVSSDSTEAINGHQLFNYAANISEYFGGKTDVIDGFKPTFTIQDNEYHNVTDAFGGLDDYITDIYTQINNVTSNSLVKWDEREKIITIGMEKGGTELDITNKDGDFRIIAGVAAGENDDDAVNFSQLKEVKTLAENGWKLSVNGGDATDVKAGNTVDLASAAGEDGSENIQIVKGDGNKVTFSLADDINVMTVTAGNSVMDAAGFRFNDGDGPSITVNGIHAGNKTIKGVAAGENDDDAVNYGQLQDVKQLATKGWKLSVDGQNATDVKAGGTVDLIAGATKSGGKNIQIKKGEDNKITFSLKDHIALSSVMTGNSIMSNDGFAFIDGGPSITSRGIDADNKKITQVAAGEQDTDAVNYKQLKEIKGQIAEDSLVKWDEGEKLITIGKEKGGTKIDITGTDGERTIAGVKDGDLGKDSKEAVNGSQINAISGDIANYFGGDAAFEGGKFVGPRYNLSRVGADGEVEQKIFNNVGDALTELDANVKNVNNHIKYVDNKFDKKFDEFSQDALLWSEEERAFVALHGPKGEKTNSKITFLKNGDISKESTDAINGSQLFKIAQNTSKYFGGSADVLEGIEPTFLIQGETYRNVFDAFTGVNVSITNIDNKISEMKENSLVKWDEGQKLITIGKDKAGTEINIAGYGKVARSISGVKAAEKGDEAVNKDQLDKSIKDITKNIETVTAAAVLYDKDEEGNVNYGSVTLGGNKNNGQVALHNVKNGSISENSHDAINGSQINKISADIAKFFGGGAKFINGAFEGLKYTLSIITEDGTVGKANYRDVGSALTGLDASVKSVNQRLTNVSNKFNQKIEGISKDALLWDDNEEAFVARHEKDGKKTNSKLKYLMDGEIADGSTEAITGNQLYFMSNQLANYFGGGAKYENGKWTDPTFNISKVDKDGKTVKTEHHNVADAFDDISDGMSNINNRIDDVINKVDSDALKWNDKEKAYDASRDGEPSKIINVADGKVEKDSKDAVNGGQLWETNERVSGVEKDVKHLNNRVDNISHTIADIGDIVNNIDGKVDNIDNKVNDIAEDAVRYDRDENGNKTNKITLTGGDASEPVVIDNVANGKIETGSKEAVNGGQLHDYTQEQMKIILDESKQYTDQRISNITIDAIDEAVDKSKHYTDMKFDVLNYSIESVRKEARQAAAIGLAVSNLRYNDTPGKLSVGFGTGLWRSQSAFAFGAGYTSENGNIRSNVSVTTSGGHWGVGAGFNMTLN